MDANAVLEKLGAIGAEAVRQTELLGILKAGFGLALLGIGVVCGIVVARRLRKKDIFLEPTALDIGLVIGGACLFLSGAVLLPLGIAQWLTPLAHLLGK